MKLSSNIVKKLLFCLSMPILIASSQSYAYDWNTQTDYPAYTCMIDDPHELLDLQSGAGIVSARGIATTQYLTAYCPITPRHYIYQTGEDPSNIYKVFVDTYSDGAYPQSPARVCTIDRDDMTTSCTNWEYLSSSAGTSTIEFNHTDLYMSGSGPGSKDNTNYVYVEVRLKSANNAPDPDGDDLIGYRVYWDLDG